MESKLKPEKYTLKEIVNEDVENIYKGLSNPKITKYYDVCFSTIEETKEQMEWCKNLIKEKNGILKEVMPKLFEKGFNELNLNRIESYVDSNNLKCKKALEKVNFTYEGTMCEMEIKKGEKLSVDFYSILKRKWT